MLTELQKVLLRDLRDCGASMPTLIWVGTIVRSDAAIWEMAHRLWKIEEQTGDITERDILKTLVDMMTEASVVIDSDEDE